MYVLNIMGMIASKFVVKNDSNVANKYDHKYISKSNPRRAGF